MDEDEKREQQQAYWQQRQSYWQPQELAQQHQEPVRDENYWDATSNIKLDIS